MPNFSKQSESKLLTCHADLQTIFRTVIQRFDFTVICGFRTFEQQADIFATGFSKKEAGKSKHNLSPSLAVDVAPFPIDWKNEKAFYYLAGAVMLVAWELDIPIRWGGDWNMNDNLNDQNFFDIGHFELIRKP